jgi:uncharacterized membrane protein
VNKLTVIKLLLVLATVNTGYLSWRYLALRQGLVEPGTAMCSITEYVDCDKVLLTPEARAFYVPNALLGFGFFFGALIWLVIGFRLGPAYHRHILRTLTFWLVIATFFTFRFVYLLVQLPALCPLCPLSHLMTYVLLALSFSLLRQTPPGTTPSALRPLSLLVALCVGQFFLWLALWFHFSGL